MMVEEEESSVVRYKYVLYVASFLLGIVFGFCFLLLLFLVPFFGLVILVCTVGFLAVKKESKRDKILVNTGRIFFCTAFLVIIVMFVLLMSALLGSLGSGDDLKLIVWIVSRIK